MNDKQVPPPESASPAADKPQRTGGKLVRFDFPPNATSEEIVAAIRRLQEEARHPEQ